MSAVLSNAFKVSSAVVAVFSARRNLLCTSGSLTLEIASFTLPTLSITFCANEISEDASFGLTASRLPICLENSSSASVASLIALATATVCVALMTPAACSFSFSFWHSRKPEAMPAAARRALR